MKILAMTVIMLLSVSLQAESVTAEKKEYKKNESQGKIISTAKKISGETKRALRIVGRKSMDATCELTESKAACEKQKAQHDALIKKEKVEGVNGN